MCEHGAGQVSNRPLDKVDWDPADGAACRGHWRCGRRLPGGPVVLHCISSDFPWQHLPLCLPETSKRGGCGRRRIFATTPRGREPPGRPLSRRAGHRPNGSRREFDGGNCSSTPTTKRNARRAPMSPTVEVRAAQDFRAIRCSRSDRRLCYFWADDVVDDRREGVRAHRCIALGTQ